MAELDLFTGFEDTTALEDKKSWLFFRYSGHLLYTMLKAHDAGSLRFFLFTCLTAVNFCNGENVDGTIFWDIARFFAILKAQIRSSSKRSFFYEVLLRK